MNRTLLLLIVPLVLTLTTKAQTKLVLKLDSTHLKLTYSTNDKFRKSDSAYKALQKRREASSFTVDSADLTLNKCDFEADANAEVLDDEGNLAFTAMGEVLMRHKRIKIFNDRGKDAANIRIEYSNMFGTEGILAVEAVTLNWVNGRVERTKLDSSLIYNVHTNKQKDAIVFSMPNVKPGSVIDYEYMWKRVSSQNVPEWDFQNDLPTRKSVYRVMLSPQFQFTQFMQASKKFSTDTALVRGVGHIWIMENLPAAKEEPFMRSKNDGLDRVAITVTAFTDYLSGKTKVFADSWATIAKQLVNEKDFYKPFEQSISDADTIIKKANSISTQDEKIRYLFNLVKSRMKWNDEKMWFTKEGIRAAWKNRTGNWGEINMILCYLLNKSGVKAYPMLTSTRDNGIIYENFANIYQVNKLVTYVPVDSTKYYVLDATDKYNEYDNIPYDLVNSTGVWMNKEGDKYGTVYLYNTQPMRSVVYINAEIKPDGSMTGTANLSNVGYNKSTLRELHTTMDEKNYRDFLTDNDNSLKITAIRMENAEVDSLPLNQSIDFKTDLSGNDDKYIYVNPNIFTSLHNNPFISLQRHTDIDFGCKQIISINGRYKIPAGYKIETLPQSMSIVMANNSVIFRRTIAAEDDYVAVNYVINYKKAVYRTAEYPDFYAYFKKLFEMLNEPIVLKKS